MVVEGVISDQLIQHQVKLTTTSGFSDQNATPRISGAQVAVMDDIGNLIPYFESTNEGIYLPEEAFQGVEGRSYKLLFTLENGSSYESNFQLLKPVTDITSLNFERNQFNNREEYFITVSTRDNPGEGDFYRWRIYRNEIEQGTLADAYLRSDRLFNGNPFNVEIDLFPFYSRDSCRVEQLSLDEEAFDFFRLIQIQAGDLGEATSTSPTQVLGNIRNIADPDEEILGFFYSTSIREATLVIP